MPKMKTKRAAAKRFKTTGTGKLMKMNANTSQREKDSLEKPLRLMSLT